MWVWIATTPWLVRQESEGMLKMWGKQWSEHFQGGSSLIKVYTDQLPEYDNIIFQGVPPLLKVCIYPLPEDNNWKFRGVSPLLKVCTYPLSEDKWFWKRFPHWSLFAPWPKKFSGSPNNSTNFFCLWISNGWGGLISTCLPLSYIIFEKFRVFLPKIYLSSHNCGIFHDSSVELFWRHPDQCGTPWRLTE